MNETCNIPSQIIFYSFSAVDLEQNDLGRLNQVSLHECFLITKTGDANEKVKTKAKQLYCSQLTTHASRFPSQIHAMEMCQC
mmetsp:Transcript_27957/g.42324  ORF Transcript_27957/g.42324 Transcript_27957/m.42324 type:complete len:82 (-) Transcript_27957:1809-2054(-)